MRLNKTTRSGRTAKQQFWLTGQKFKTKTKIKGRGRGRPRHTHQLQLTFVGESRL
jgi:hypothetical protein